MKTTKSSIKPSSLETKTELKLVYSTDKKVLIRELGCKRCQNKDWSHLYNGVF